MTPSDLKEILRIAEGHLLAGNYEDVLRLIKLDSSLKPTPKEGAHLNLLFASAHIGLGNYDVFSKLSLAIDYYRHSAEHVKFAFAKYYMGYYQAHLGEFLEAKESLIEAYASFKRVKNIYGQAKSLNRLAYLENHHGNYANSLQYLYRCRSLLGSENKSQLSIVLGNIALNEFLLGKICHSIYEYQEIEHFVADCNMAYQANFYLMSAAPYAMLADYPKAITQLEKAKPYLDDYKRQKAIYHEYYGWILNLQGSH